jgi:tetratricopeptide (TPR) repeat protein
VSRSRVVIATFILLSVCLSSGRNAATAGDIAKARQHFERATTLFDLQRYLEAAHEYELAYEEKNDPAILFNIGQSYRLANDYAHAIGAFRSFLRKTPQTKNREEVEARIAEMQRLLEAQKQSDSKPPAGVAPIEKPAEKAPEQPSEPPATVTPTTPSAPARAAATAIVTAPARREKTPVARRWWVWTLVVGGAVVALGLGLGLGLGLSGTSYPTETVPPVVYRP